MGIAFFSHSSTFSDNVLASMSSKHALGRRRTRCQRDSMLFAHGRRSARQSPRHAKRSTLRSRLGGLPTKTSLSRGPRSKTNMSAVRDFTCRPPSGGCKSPALSNTIAMSLTLSIRHWRFSIAGDKANGFIYIYTHELCSQLAIHYLTSPILEERVRYSVLKYIYIYIRDI